MATEQPGFTLGTQVANADLRTKQFLFAKAVSNSGSKIDIVAAAGGAGIGVLQNKPNTGEVAEVMVTGVSKVVASGAINPGSLISSDATGKAKVAAAGEIVMGQSIGTTGAANELLEVLLGAPGSGGKA